MKTILLLAIVAICAMPSSGAPDGNQNDRLQPTNLYARYGECFVVSATYSEPIEAPVQLPRLEGVPVGNMGRLEQRPEYAARFREYPLLAKRQRELEADREASILFLLDRQLPIYQIFDQWIGAPEGGLKYYETDARGLTKRLDLGLLRIAAAPYRQPTMGIQPPADYKQPRADLVKPLLFFVNGDYYSVYGDCQLARHVPVEGAPDRPAAFRYAGNPLYACSQELPPGLQSCGVDNEGHIWLVDFEGHIAFFNTKTLEFGQKCAVIDGVKEVLIPRDNQSRSMFAFSKDAGAFQEFRLDADEKVVTPAMRRTLPAAATHVLYCDDEIVVFLTSDTAVLVTRGAERSVALGIEKAEKVWEGLFLPTTGDVCLLVAPFPLADAHLPEAAKLEETEKSWNNMRLIRVSVPQGTTSTHQE